MTATIHSRLYGHLPSGEAVSCWTLHGEGGLRVELIEYGATVTRIMAPDREGRIADVVLGFDHLEDYLGEHPYFGATVGRVAGRISRARFAVEGTIYSLEANDRPNHLHGGVSGFHRKLWKASVVERQDGAPSLALELVSADGEEGYPGRAHICVTYTVTNDNTLLMETAATVGRATPLSLTQHSYFNLAGEAMPSIEDHWLQIQSDLYVAVDERMTLTGELKAVNDPGNDFRVLRCIGDSLPHLFLRHGDLYLLRDAASDGGHSCLHQAARLLHPRSGRVLDIWTTESYLQLYTGAALDGTLRGKSGAHYGPHAGVCLETERYPDEANLPANGKYLLHPGQVRYAATAYLFSNCANDGSLPPFSYLTEGCFTSDGRPS